MQSTIDLEKSLTESAPCPRTKLSLLITEVSTQTALRHSNYFIVFASPCTGTSPVTKEALTKTTIADPKAPIIRPKR